MGTWGAGIYENDTALDAQWFLEEALEAGKTLDEALDHVCQEMGVDNELLALEHDLLLVLANELLERGVTSHPLYEAARGIIVSGADVEGSWRGAGASEEIIQKREVVLQEFLARLPATS